ncbi:MAG TPA: alpha-amylase family glycosyl hydrolase, partial [Pirellulaceae bacterium]|nr:alpha-amylase family glycosyl hydrolase [Pirellulaceae bacterium]
RLHKSDIQCMLDFVPNHTSPSYISGRLLERGKEVVESHYADGQLKILERWYNHYGSMTAPGDSDRAPDRYLKDSAGLSDFNTDNPRVANYIRDAARFWVLEKGVDALRLDSIKHVDPDFLRRMCEDVAEEAYRKRNRELFIVGEWYGGGANEASSVDFVNHADHCELLDFGLYYELKKVLAGSQSMRVLDQHLNLRRQAFRGRESWQVTFMDNHDTRRIAVDLEDPGSGAGLPRALVHQRMDLGMALIMTLPGIPSIYYGTEQYLANFGEEWQGNSYMVGYEPFSRPMMPKDFKADTRMCRIIRTLAELRRRSIALQQAPYEERWLDDNTLVFQRAIGDDVVVVAANRGPPRSITVEQLKLADGEYRDLLAEKTAPPIQVSGGAARLDLPREGVVVLSSRVNP